MEALTHVKVVLKCATTTSGVLSVMINGDISMHKWSADNLASRADVRKKTHTH